MTFYYMIGSALQRRVWLGNSEMPIFANQYIILVGEPGVGKGLVIKPAIHFMSYHKAKRSGPMLADNLEDSTELIQKYIEEIKTMQNKSAPASYIEADPLLFPIPATATTYEALTLAHTRAHRWFKPPPEMRKYSLVPPSGIYGHSSMCFLLEELSSLFKKNTNSTVDLLLALWDCGNYTYATKHQGEDVIKNICLSMLAGTTPGFMRDTYNEKLIDEGFSARALFIFEERNRFDLYGIPDLGADQLEAKARILVRLKELSTFFGQAQLSPDGMALFKDYFERVLPRHRINTNLKLQPYYSKKNMHASKLAMALHFADHNTMTIELESCQKALDILETLEVKMHFALSSGGKSPLAACAKKIVRFLSAQSEPKSRHEIWYALDGEIREAEMLEVLHYLVTTRQLEEVKEQDKLKWKIKPTISP